MLLLLVTVAGTPYYCCVLGGGEGVRVSKSGCLANEGPRGRLVIDRKTKQAKLNCRNWESGVVVPVGRGEDGTQRGASAASAAAGAAPEAELSQTFRAAVPVPMQEPGREYAEDEQPWFYLEHFHSDATK